MSIKENIKKQEKPFKNNKKEGEMAKKKKIRGKIWNFIAFLFGMIFSFTLGGAGLFVLFDAKGNLVSIIGGFALLAISISIFLKFFQDY